MGNSSTVRIMVELFPFFLLPTKTLLLVCIRTISHLCNSNHFRITLSLLFTYASFSQCDIFSQSLPNWLYNVDSISATYTSSTVRTILHSILALLFIYASFTQCDIFSQLLHNWLCNNVYSISATYTYGNVYNYTTQYTGFAVYICFPFHNVIFFHNYLTIDSTTIFPAYPQHIPRVLFTITLTSILTLLFIYASFTQCDIFSQLLYNCLYDNVYIESSLLHTVLYKITPPSILTVLFTYAILFTMWYFSAMTAQFTLQQCLQHILNIYIRYCLQLHYPVYWLCFYICYPFHNMIFFHNYCTIDSTTMSMAYP